MHPKPIPFYTAVDGTRFPQIELEFNIQGQICRFCINGLEVKPVLLESNEWKYEILGRLNEISRDLARVLMLELSREKWPRNEYPVPWVILMTPLKKIILPLQNKIITNGN